jgi:peptide/nickel transport system substrate-binding protein
MLNKRCSIVLAVVVIGSFLLSACAQPTPEVIEKEVTKIVEKEGETVVETKIVTEKEVVTATPEPIMTPQEGGRLEFAHYWEVDTLDPHVSYSRHAWLVFYQLYDTLLVADADMNFHPGLAKEWEVTDDGKTFTFYLREGVTFHDGTPFNAEAVKYNPDTRAMMLADLIGPYTGTDVVDDYTVKVHFSEPHGPFVIFAATKSWMISPQAAEEWGPEDYGLHPVGTGPFQFVEWVPQQYVLLERNPDYNWAADAIHTHNGPAYLDELKINFVIEDSTRAAALEAGDVHVATKIPEYDVQRFRDSEDFVVQREMVPGLPTTFILNCNKPPLDDVRVRRALNLWLDRELINETVYAGERAPSFGPLAPNTFGYWPGVEEVNTLNRDRAMELLAEAGWEDSDGDGLLDDGSGETLKLDIFSCGEETDPPEAVGAQFDEMGADTSIHMVPWEEQKRVCYEGQHHMMVATFNNPDAQVLRLLFHSDNFGEVGWMWGHLHESNPELQAELEALLDEGDSTVAVEPRRLAYEQAQQLIVENALAMPMTLDFYIFGVSNQVHGWSTTATRWPLYYNMWLEQ